MIKLPGPGPVFAVESRAAARGWYGFAARSLFVAGLLGGLAAAEWAERAGARPPVRRPARVAFLFFVAISGTQLALVLLAAPAATAGGLCLDKSRGTLVLMLVTDLSVAEIVLGKLAARLVPVLGLVACGVPVMALATLLGGVDPVAMLGATLITLGTAALGCALALALSVWGTKVHEVLLATYAIWAVWLSGAPGWLFLNRIGWLMTGPPGWLTRSHPVLLLWDLSQRMGDAGWRDPLCYLAGTLAIATALTTVAIRRVRDVAVRQADRGGARGDGPARLRRGRGPALDRNPVLWREWHRRRPAGWLGLIWALFDAVAMAATAIVLALVARGIGPQSRFGSLLIGTQVAAGMLLLAVSSTTALAEERVRGALDVLLATPLPTRAIVLGKWWGAVRDVPRLAVLPGLAALAVACRTGRYAGVLLVVGQVFSYGAALAGLGLALATWLPNVGRAATLGVTAHVLVTVGWVFLMIVLSTYFPGPAGPGLASASPFLGVSATLIVMQGDANSAENWRSCRAWISFWIVADLAAAAALFAATLATFDRCLGRASDGGAGRSSPLVRPGRHAPWRPPSFNPPADATA
jgi:ABC-type transport system involved in multi-copper enzyme maturation permease subunit